MKRLVLISLLIVLLVSQVAYGVKPVTLEEAVSMANEEIASKYDGDPNYYDLSKVNKEVWGKYGALVYGMPHGDKKGNDQRYIGYTPDGKSFGSPTFPRDDWSGGTFDERNWIEYPWDDPRTRAKGAEKNSFNGTQEFNANMMAGLGMYYPKDTDGSRKDWHKYMQILQPPTEYTDGMAMMWHVRGGTIWYTTMHLPSHEASSIFLTAGGPIGGGGDPDVNDPTKEPILPPIETAPVEVKETPRTPNVAVKWDTVPVKIGNSSSTTGKIERDNTRTWNEYKYVVENWFPNEKSGKIISTNVIKTVNFSNNMFLKAKNETSNSWFTDSPKASYRVPTNAKPGTVLIIKMEVRKRTNHSFPSGPPTPQKPQPEVSMPSYSRPRRPSSPSRPYSPSRPHKDADDREWDYYYRELDYYYDELDYYYRELDYYYRELDYYNSAIGPWNAYDSYISSYAYQQYLLRVADVNKLSSVRSSYNTNVDGNPTLIAVSGYNFSEYAAYHSNYNNFVNSHTRRFVRVEGDSLRLHWFTNDSTFGKAESKNVVVHSAVAPGQGGIGPGIIIKP